MILLDFAKGFVPAFSRRISSATSPACSPAARRCSGTGGRCSCASSRVGSRGDLRRRLPRRRAVRRCARRRRLDRRLPRSSRYASVASMVAACSLPVIAALLGEPWPVVAFGSLAAVAVIVLHRAEHRGGCVSRRPRTRFRFGAVQHVARRSSRSQPSHSRSSVCRAAAATLELAAQLADRAVALREHVVGVDRLEVDLAGEQEVVVVELRVGVERVASARAAPSPRRSAAAGGRARRRRARRAASAARRPASSSSPRRSAPAARR